MKSEQASAGGYAREMSEDYKRRQAALIAERAKAADIVITTALIPGRPAPVLVPEETVKGMKPGSVIVDLAVRQGGNCPLSVEDEGLPLHTLKSSRPRIFRRHWPPTPARSTREICSTSLPSSPIPRRVP